ncbi:MAG: hydroxyacid dehydrogenase [Halanaerobiales bacterium]
MSRKNGYVLLPHPVREEAVEILENEDIEVVLAEKPDISIIAPLIKKARAVILRTGAEMDRELLEKADDLRTISRTGVGVDNVDLEAATEKGVVVTSSLGVNTSSVAEHCMALILGLTKKLFLLDKETRTSNFKVRYQYYPQDIKGKRLGVVGFGRIGQKVAGYFQIMSGKKIFAFDPLLPEEIKREFEEKVVFVTLEKLLKKSDIVSLHVPLNSNTEGLIGMEELETMGSDAFIVNVARGGVINEGDLIEALQKGIIGGAALDVFQKEPPEKDNPLLEMNNVILTPHAAALTEECVVRMATAAAERVISVLQGNKPENIANPEVLSDDRWQHLE